MKMNRLKGFSIGDGGPHNLHFLRHTCRPALGYAIFSPGVGQGKSFLPFQVHKSVTPSTSTPTLTSAQTEKTRHLKQWVFARQLSYLITTQSQLSFLFLCLFLQNTPAEREEHPKRLLSLSRALCVHVCLLSRVQLCNPMDCSPPGSYVHGMLQARILEGVAMPSSRGSS